MTAIKIIKGTEANKMKKILQRNYEGNKEIEEKVREIIESVKEKGDTALQEFTERFDGVKLKSEELRVKEEEIEGAFERADKKLINALEKAKENIEFFAEKQKPREWEIEKDGIILGETVRPLDSVGLYVPAGKYPLPSSVLMNAIPAKTAGVKRIVMCSPPNKEGKINEGILVAAKICGIKEIYKVGGAQAIAALAFGTETIKPVNKIVGPGNVFVTTAKKQVFGRVGIDFIAGPSEVMVLAEKGNSEFIAADLLAQAEHDTMASAIMVTDNKELAFKVQKEVEKQLQDLSTREVAEKALENSAILLVKDLKKAIELVNEFAPEHLEIFGEENLAKKVQNAGSIFLGEYSCEAFGDYCSGTNHVLPTNGAARYCAGLSTRDFMKCISYQKVSKEKAKELSKIASVIAEAEGLEAHKKAVEKRC